MARRRGLLGNEGSFPAVLRESVLSLNENPVEPGGGGLPPTMSVPISMNSTWLWHRIPALSTPIPNGYPVLCQHNHLGLMAITSTFTDRLAPIAAPPCEIG
jgi:hypothetical protein